MSADASGSTLKRSSKKGKGTGAVNGTGDDGEEEVVNKNKRHRNDKRMFILCHITDENQAHHLSNSLGYRRCGPVCLICLDSW